MGIELAEWGRVLLLETTGHRSGASRVAVVGFVEEADGSLLVAAGEPHTAWAGNLIAEPRCHVTIAERHLVARAEPLSGTHAQRAVVELILRYGTPAERLGRGPAFRLVPISTDEPDPA